MMTSKPNKTVRLPPAARAILRGVLARHPNVKQHLPSGRYIKSLRRDELLSLAKQLQVDVASIVAGTNVPAKAPRAVSRSIERLPRDGEARFHGTLEFELKLELFGKLITRRARVGWGHTPEWEFYDHERERLVAGSGHTEMHFEVLIASPTEVQVVGAGGDPEDRPSVPLWTKINLAEEGLLTENVYEEIDAQIDRMCREEDTLRRMAFLGRPRGAQTSPDRST